MRRVLGEAPDVRVCLAKPSPLELRPRVGSAPPEQATLVDVGTVVERARIAMAEGDLEAALTILETGAPGDALTIAMLRAQVLEAMDDVAAALRVLEDAASIEPTSPRPALERGRLLHGLGCLDAALEAFRAAELVCNGLPAAVLGRARVIREQCGEHEALAVVDAAVGEAPECAELHHERGRILEAMGRMREASSALERAHARAPENPDIAASLGANAFRNGAFERAVAAYRRAFESEPEPVERRRLGRCLALSCVEARAFDEAESTLAGLLEEHPRDPDVALELARVAQERLGERALESVQLSAYRWYKTARDWVGDAAADDEAAGSLRRVLHAELHAAFMIFEDLEHGLDILDALVALDGPLGLRFGRRLAAALQASGRDDLADALRTECDEVGALLSDAGL